MKKFKLNQKIKIIAPGWSLIFGKIIDFDKNDSDEIAPYLVEFGYGLNKERVYFSEDELCAINSDRIKKRLGIK